MSEINEKPYPDCWYSITKKGEFIKSSEQKDEVISDSAQYYVRATYAFSLHGNVMQYNYNNFFVYNRNFQESYLEYRGVTCKEIKEVFGGRKLLTCYIADKTGHVKTPSFNAGISGFIECLEYMENLSRFNTWEELILSETNTELRQKVNSLNEIKQLQSKLNNWDKVRNDLEKIYLAVCEDNPVKQSHY
jgi:hypothetical protein